MRPCISILSPHSSLPALGQCDALLTLPKQQLPECANIAQLEERRGGKREECEKTEEGKRVKRILVEFWLLCVWPGEHRSPSSVK